MRAIGFLPAVDDEDALHKYWRTVAPTYAQLSVAINSHLYETESEWAGIPMPLPGAGLVVESRYPRAEQLRGFQAIIDEEEAPDPDAAGETVALGTVVNEWHCHEHHRTVTLYRDADGRTQYALSYDVSVRNDLLWGPFATLEAWDVARETRALALLKTLISAKMFKSYILTGAFLETSKRSGVHYWFRKLRPTLALSPRDAEVRILAALCLHPIAYYKHTFCGAMVPTDDVIAHLLLMRADEHMYWRRSEQHHPSQPEAGI